MQTWILFAIGIVAIVVLGVVMVALVLLRNMRTAQGPAVQGKYPQGHWMSIGMCIGIALGCIPSVAGILFDEMSSFVAFGPAIGCALGVPIGSALEQKHKAELRPLTEEEQRTRFRLTLVALGALALLVLSLFVLGGMVLSSPR